MADGMQKRGHQVEYWSPKPKFFKLPAPGFLKKWLGYLDQYFLFPAAIKNRVKKDNSDTLYVLTDHALGPWLPLVASKAHVVHCHDFIAQQSAFDLIPQNIVSWTGKKYQAYIRRGYLSGKNFISVSKKTQSDLNHFINSKNIRSEVVYNGLNQSFKPKNPVESRKKLGDKTGLNLLNGYILHIGGNQFYKNRNGVVAIYTAWRNFSTSSLPLLLIGTTPDQKLANTIASSAYKSDIYHFNNIEDDLISAAYSGASVFLFPSLIEGFGWPIAEAMACGCPVITTNEAPMTEVAGHAAFLIPKQPINTQETQNWAHDSAKIVEKIVSFSVDQRQKAIAAGIENARRFDTDLALDQIENIYKSILLESKI
ncbi:MAG: glycosyltransferase [Sphingobacteriaceae bacterium]|nr:MAG: glycosyltransferase [Sphingobacteriaceae bacterium]